MAALVIAPGQPVYAQAQIFEKMLMPGPLVQGHAEFEQNCDACHTSFAKDSQTALCLDCHELVAQDLDDSVGFHGKDPRVGGKDCVDCHTEHEGRNGVISPLTNSSFRHEFTDFPLEGSHRVTACVECHEKDKPRREAEGECVACHLENDAHDGTLGEDCAQCHSPESWKENTFNHAETTEFPLEGGHGQVSCVACHGAAVHKDTPSECVSCHVQDDTHSGVNGNECQGCHVPEKWDVVRFDHTTDGKWELLGKHREVACELCHTVTLTEPKLETTCVSCHGSDDAHQGKNGAECQECHNNESWKESQFDHAVDTEFPLNGTHRELQCEACHRGAMDEGLDMTCASCHLNADVHEGSLESGCENCHNDEGWLAGIRFDHDMSAFPLIGTHAIAPCETCHVDKRFRDTTSGCVDCHLKDDAHEGSLGDQCMSCHNPNGWAFWNFDHNTQTDFVLEGTHETVTCQSCHSSEKIGTRESPRNCGVCHKRDDVHRGRFGRNCEQCHGNTSFSEVRRLQ